ncbi:MAG: adenosine deaminase [Anaerolineae bacterium]|nr:adenosine deaminase [Anaerolineae bacterium]
MLQADQIQLDRIRHYVRALPKAELHVHLEGTVQPATLLDLAAQHGVELPVSTIEEVTDWYTFRDFNHFIAIFRAISQCLRTPADFTRITYEYGRSMAKNNIRYAEVTWTPYSHVGDPTKNLTFADLLNAINAGRDQAKQEWGVDMRWIPDIMRGQPETAPTLVKWLTSSAAQAGGVVALGLGGPEIGFPPELFAEAFSVAKAKGLPGNPHAGETVGPASVWGSLRALNAVRIGHGVRAVEDPALVDYLVEHQIPLEVNPTSNLCLNVYSSYAEHSLRQLIEAGAMVTINSDDPALFNTTLNDEYIHAVLDCGLTLDQLEQTGLNAVRASYLPPDDKATLLASFEANYARLRAKFEL